MVRYQRLSDIPDNWDKEGNPRHTIDLLMTAGIMAGNGDDPDGNNDLIDISHDMMRMFIMNYRGGAYNEALKAAGLPPVYND